MIVFFLRCASNLKVKNVEIEIEEDIYTYPGRRGWYSTLLY